MQRFDIDAETRTDRWRVAHDILELLGPAQAATAAGGQVALACGDRLGARRRNSQIQLDAFEAHLRLDRLQLRGRRDDRFAEAEAEREIIEVGRCCQHHGVRATVVVQRNRHFAGDPVDDRLDSAVGESLNPALHARRCACLRFRRLPFQHHAVRRRSRETSSNTSPGGRLRPASRRCARIQFAGPIEACGERRPTPRPSSAARVSRANAPPARKVVPEP